MVPFMVSSTKKYHSSFKEIVDRYGFQDLLLIDANSMDILYNVNKGPVFASNLQNGAFADTELAKLAKSLQQNPEAGLQISAISAFNGSFQQEVLFFGVPVFHPNSGDTPPGLFNSSVPCRESFLRFDNRKSKMAGFRVRPDR